jgi:hypothetical protein
MIPEKIIWEDGAVYDIDKILDIRPAAALKAGSGGDRFTISVQGKQTYLFFERFADPNESGIGRWFVERR